MFKNTVWDNLKAVDKKMYMDVQNLMMKSISSLYYMVHE